MVCFDLWGIILSVDFTAPALLALLSLMLPQRTVLRMLAAALLHEGAHLLMLALLRRKPAALRISASGMLLEAAGTAMMPLRDFAGILCAGPLANLLAGSICLLSGSPETAAANLSLCVFNLLPFRSTDGGTLLLALLETVCLPRAPRLPRLLMRLLSTLTALLLGVLMAASGLRNASLCGMLIYMLLAEWIV